MISDHDWEYWYENILPTQPVNWDNREEVISLISREGIPIEHASDRLKNDYELALLAVSHNSFSLKYLPSEFRDNDTIVETAIRTSVCGVAFASERLKRDKHIAYIVINEHPCGICFMSEEIKSDRDIMLSACQKDIDVLQYATEELRSDPYFLYQCSLIDSNKAREYAYSPYNQHPELYENFTDVKPAKC